MSGTRTSPQLPAMASGSRLFLVLAFFEAMTTAVQSATITVNDGDKIQDALDAVNPGDTIKIKSGQYYEDIHTTVDGTADLRITVRGAGGSRNGPNVVLRGAGGIRVFEVNHDYYTIKGFTIDGENLEEDPNDDNYLEAYRNKLLYVTPTREPTTRDGGYRSALDGLIVHDMTLKNAGGECMRLRYFVTNAEIYDNDIESCGLYDYEFNDGGENGEGIYIGTSDSQWDNGKNPTDDPDVCSGNVIRDNVIKTKGNEGVDVKEGSVDNIIEDNKIYMQKDTDSGGISSRGDGTIIRNNYIEDAAGAGVRLGGNKVSGNQYGTNNQVYGNTMVDCQAFGVKIMTEPQGQICGNDIELPDGKDDEDYEYTGGTYGSDFDAIEDCMSGPSPTPTPSQPHPVTPAPTEEPESGSEYLGCFADVRGSRTMRKGYKDTDGMSNEDCIMYCKDEGKKYAGTSRGHTCRCTNNSTRIDRNGESTECTEECPGDDSSKCGGRWAVSTYEV